METKIFLIIIAEGLVVKKLSFPSVFARTLRLLFQHMNIMKHNSYEFLALTKLIYSFIR